MPKDNTPTTATTAAAAVSTTAAGIVDTVDQTVPDTPPAGMWTEAWRRLRRRPLFWISVTIILLVLLVAAFPSLFTSVDPAEADLLNSLEGAKPGHPFDFTQQGYDVYARVIYGARASVIVGIAVTFFVTLIGILMGALAGYYGGFLDSLLSRITDIFFAIPLLLAGIVLMQLFPQRNIGTVILVLSVFGWSQMARVVRGAVITVKTMTMCWPRGRWENPACLSSSHTCYPTVWPPSSSWPLLRWVCSLWRRRRSPSSVLVFPPPLLAGVTTFPSPSRHSAKPLSHSSGLPSPSPSPSWASSCSVTH